MRNQKRSPIGRALGPSYSAFDLTFMPPRVLRLIKHRLPVRNANRDCPLLAAGYWHVGEIPKRPQLDAKGILDRADRF